MVYSLEKLTEECKGGSYDGRTYCLAKTSVENLRAAVDKLGFIEVILEKYNIDSLEILDTILLGNELLCSNYGNVITRDNKAALDAYEELDHTLCLNSSRDLKFNLDTDYQVDCENLDEMISCLETVKDGLVTSGINNHLAKSKQTVIDIFLAKRIDKISLRIYDSASDYNKAIMKYMSYDKLTDDEFNALKAEYKNLPFPGVLPINSEISAPFVILHLPFPVIRSFFPSLSFFSIIVTSLPSLDDEIAAIIPAAPPPITIIFFILPPSDKSDTYKFMFIVIIFLYFYFVF
jgi:hypothetical protein